MKKNLCAIAVILVLLHNYGWAEDHRKIYATWEGFEADKLASIWLIQRFVDPGARVVLHPKGVIISEGEPFDTPDSSITRNFKQSTFESMLDHYKLTDPKLTNLGKLIHDIEINTWETKLYRKNT